MTDPPDTCPGIDTLERLALGASPGPEVAAHMAACAECRALLDDLRENLRCAESLRKMGPGHDEGPVDLLAGYQPLDGGDRRIGPYRVLRKLGQGGMGAVYEAEQDNPRRVVALKMIRPGLISPGLLARFRHEAQVLGRLRHPGIAQIYEAGTHQSDHGPQPYFALELVSGPPILEYASSRQLTTPQRLELLARVCDAVHHAHQRGVIHRDLKPDNILVDDSGGAPAPKILDFGVARLVDPDAQTTTLHTSAGQIVGTVAYMSPEQASGRPEEIDTRSDVYALGVIGYQLLCGQLPYRVSPGSIAESVRVIVQDEPAPLSSVVRTLRGDVTTIIGKALSKEKARRYPSAAEMAADLRRYLHDEPITAHPPSTMYQLGKFARRNRGLVAGVATAFVVLVGGVIGTSLGLVRAQRERDLARAARAAADAAAVEARVEADKQAAVNGFLQDMLAAANPRRATAADKARGREVTVLEALNEAAKKVDDGALKSQPEVEMAVRLTMGVTYSEIGQLEPADRHARAALDLARREFGAESRQAAEVMSTMAYIRRQQGKLPEAEAFARDALALSRKIYGSEHRNVAASLSSYGSVLQDLGRHKEAEPVLRESAEMRRRLLGEENLELAVSYNNLALVLDELGRFGEAEALYRSALAIRRKLLGEEHPDNASSLNNLGFVLRSQGKFDEAEAAFRASLAMRRKFFGDENLSVALTVNNLGSLLQARKRYDEAEPLYVEAMTIQRKVLGPEHPSLAMSINNLATLYREQGRFAEAEPLFRQSLAIRRKALGESHPAVAVGLANLSSVLRELGKAEEGEALAREAVRITLAARGPDAPETAAHRSHLGLCLVALKRYDDAEQEMLEAWRVLEPRFASGDPRAISAATNLRRLYLQCGRDADAGRFAALLATTRPATTRPLPAATAPARAGL